MFRQFPVIQKSGRAEVDAFERTNRKIVDAVQITIDDPFFVDAGDSVLLGLLVLASSDFPHDKNCGGGREIDVVFEFFFFDDVRSESAALILWARSEGNCGRAVGDAASAVATVAIFGIRNRLVVVIVEM